MGGRRSWTRQTVTLGARSDGTLAGIELAAVVDMGAGGWIFPVAEPVLSIYACENVRAMVFPVRTSLRAQNAFRAPGVVEGVTVLEQAMDELARGARDRPARAAAPEPRRPRPGLGASLLEQAAARLLRPRGRACRLGRARRAPRAARRRAPPRDGLRDADLVGRRRAARACDGAPRRRGARAGHDGHPGHRHGDADLGADGRRRGARAPARARLRAGRRHAAERLQPGLGRLDDDAGRDARRAERGREGAPHPPEPRRRRARDLGRRPRALGRPDPLARRRARRRRRRR